MNIKRNIPQIRFKGFAGDWEERTLGEIADIVGGGTPNTANPDYWDGDIDWYAPAEIAEQIYVNSSERKITNKGFENCSAKILPIGTVLFTSRAGIGKTAILSKEGCTNQGFQSIVPHKNELDSYFIFSRTEELKRYGETKGAGSTFVEVSGKQMASMELMMPKTIKEQQKIGEYFSNLDRLIKLHQSKLETFRKLKKSMLQKMFPKTGSQFPEIRFKGFTAAWEQRTLGDEALEIIAGGDIDKSKTVENGKYPIYANALTDNGIVGYYDDYYRVKAPAVTVTGRGDVGHAQARTIDFTPVVRLLAIRSIHDCYFLENAINEHKVLVESTGVPQLTVPQLSAYKISFPNSLEEEKKIGTYFRSLDTLITLHQRKCETLRKLKKSMLQKMFI
ncbi:MAG: restriction endonuclease subunit S [Ruminococcus sp.]|nr:restriction endonuclease subunit S [Ruminococcus sp.]